MLLALAIAAVTLVVVATVVLPLMKGARAAPERAAFDRAVYRDQLKELERDRARGLIDGDEAAAARLEIERRLLAADAPAAAAVRSAGSPVLAVALALLLPATAAGIYLALGAPAVPDEPYAVRGPERALAAAQGQHRDVAGAIAALEQELNAHPDDAEKWLLLARSAATLGQWQKRGRSSPKNTAATQNHHHPAYQKALALTKNRPDIASAYGEMLVFAADGIVTPRAQEAFTAALARAPKDMAARYYLALAAAQAGNAQAAIDAWQKLAADIADPELRDRLRARITETADGAGITPPKLAAAATPAGPSAEDEARAAQMTPEQRQQMIRGMVDGLAAKLKANPEDLDGWMRLARAYTVLGERGKAADAYEQAARLKPEDMGIPLAEADTLITDHSPQVPLPERAVALWQRVDAQDPKQPQALWYLGLAAAQQRRLAAASGYWERLLPLLPEGSDQHKMVAAAIAALQGKQ
jgi:cytochrome c-type biogenesis protein CcmH